MIELLVLIVIGSIWFGLLMHEIQSQHEELMGLLNDLATMVGEWLEEQER